MGKCLLNIECFTWHAVLVALSDLGQAAMGEDGSPQARGPAAFSGGLGSPPPILHSFSFLVEWHK